MWAELLTWIDSVLLGSVFTLCRANSTVQKKIDQCRIEQFDNDERLKHSKQVVDARLSGSIERLERIENKAMGTLLGVAVAVALLGAATGILGSDGMIANEPLWLRIVAAALLLISMTLLFGSGFLALGAYKVGQVYRPTMFDQEPLAEEEHERKMVLLCIEQNDRAATLRSNRLSASFCCLRNGLATVLLLGVFIVIVTLVTGDTCRPT